MLKNKEIKLLLLSCAVITLTGTLLIRHFSEFAWLLTALTGSCLIAVFAVFTRYRYQKLEQLSSYLEEVLRGIKTLDLRDYEEGELSYLKDRIYKVTLKLTEQSQNLHSDKKYLADTLSDISHQLKTPLTSMMVMADLLSQDQLPAAKRQEFAGQIVAQLERIEWLVSALLKMSKLDAGSAILKKELIYAKELVEAASSHLLLGLAEKQISFCLTGDEQAAFTGDFAWTREAISNILKNCMEHTPAGGKLEVFLEQNHIYTMIRIRDTGCGIDADDLPHIFERFYKGKNSASDSVGIGLAMAQQIILMENGKLEVVSTPGKGSTFSIRFYHMVV